MATSGLVLKPAKWDSIFSNPSLHGPEEISPPSEAIQIYLSTLGAKNSVMPLKLSSSDTIASVKMRIQAYRGFYIKQQRLVYGGRELCRDDTSIKDYGVTNGEVLHLVLRLSDLQVVTIKTVNGKEYVFKLERTKSVRDLKLRISKREGGLALEEQQLVLRGERLEDETRIDDLPLEDDTVVHLFIRKAAKVTSKFVGKDVELSVCAKSSNQQESINRTSVTKGGEHRTNSVQLPLTSSSPKQDHIGSKVEALHTSQSPVGRGPESKSPRASIPSVLLDLIRQVRAGLERGHAPVLSSEGSGGAYFMQNEYGTDVVGVFKPMDEEPMAANNPRGLPLSMNGEGLKRGTRVGEGALREVAAYLLDHPAEGPWNCKGKGFSGVPPTIMVRCSHKAFHYSAHRGASPLKGKIGSLQLFVHAFSNCEDMGPASFPVEEVHKITVLDMRLANTDRNGGNILVCKQGLSGALKLVPIDHGYCLPDKFEDCTFEWLYWPQARVPYQPATLQYIATLNAQKDIALLRDHGWDLPPECARVLQVATMLLKKGAAAGLTPYEIGSMMCRESLNKKSAIEIMLEEAEGSVLPASSEKLFMDSLSEIIGQYVLKEKARQSYVLAQRCADYALL